VESRFFKWSCFGLAALAVAALLWMINDLRGEVKRTNEAVNQHLPQILANAKVATDTMAKLSKDIEALRDLAGLTAPSDRSLALYADGVLDFLDTQPGQIGLDKKLGAGMKDLVPVQDWVREARREALWLTFRASSKAELLDRLGKNKFGSKWYYAPPAGEPVPLIDFVTRAKPP
jgi:hypothetical protein